MDPGSDFDPYLRWLGIRQTTRPPNAYRLLGIELFEADSEVIQTAADRQMAHLRTFQNGPRSALSQSLLNEVSAARVLLLDPVRKSVYDAELAKANPVASESRNANETATQRRHEIQGHEIQSPEIQSPEIQSHGIQSPEIQGHGIQRRSIQGRRGIRAILAAAGIILAAIAYLALMADTPTEIAHNDPSHAASASGSGTGAEPQAAPSVAGGKLDSEAADPAEESPPAGAEPSFVENEESTTAETSDIHGAANEPQDIDVGAPIVAEALQINMAPAAFQSWGELSPWTEDPFASTTATPIGKFLFELSHRNPEGARGMLAAIRRNQALDVDEIQLANAELVLTSVAAFWSAVDQADTKLSVGDTLNYRNMLVKVSALDAASVELTSPTGEVRSFARRISELELPLAIALADYRLAPSRPIVWRLAAACLAIDHRGNQLRSSEYEQLAETRGASTDFLIRAVRRLRGTPELPQPPVALTAEPTEGNSSAPPDTLADAVSIPDHDAQREARRTVLSPELKRLRDAKVAREKHGVELFEKAKDPTLTPAAVYVLLTTSSTRSTTVRDMDMAWAAIERLENEYGEDGQTLRYRALQRMTRRLKGEERRPYVHQCRQLSRAAVLREDFDGASRFASLAIEIAQPINDHSLSNYLMQQKKEVLAVKDAAGEVRIARDTLQKSPGDAWAQAEIARFELLTKGNFAALGNYQSISEPRLRAQVHQELNVGRLPTQHLELGDSWFRFSHALSGVQQTNALRRARYWLELAREKLEGEQGEQVRQDLDAINLVLGRETDVVDLTKLTPLNSRVGFGSLGVDRNPDQNNSRVQPLPKRDNVTIQKFFWACAPSSIEFAVPSDARHFMAIGLLNANSVDGARFRVLSDGESIYASPILRTMGREIPIQVKLPAGTKRIALNVEPIGSSLNDHTYWVNPELRVHLP